MAKSGIMFFEDGEIAVFGTLNTVRYITEAINTKFPELVRQERNMLLSSITNEELEQLIEKRSAQNVDDE